MSQGLSLPTVSTGHRLPGAEEAPTEGMWPQTHSALEAEAILMQKEATSWSQAAHCLTVYQLLRGVMLVSCTGRCTSTLPSIPAAAPSPAGSSGMSPHAHTVPCAAQPSYQPCTSYCPKQQQQFETTSRSKTLLPKTS